MQNSKLLDLLKTFEKEDWRWFRKFLLSPYFNSREELVPFFDYLRKQAPDFNEKAIRKEKVFKKLYPKEVYDEKQISYAMNFLLIQAESFLAQREIERHPPLVNNQLLKSLVSRKLDKHYKYQFEKSIKALDKYQYESLDYFLFNFQIEEIGDTYFLNQHLKKYDSHLQNAYDNLRQFYFIKVLKYSCAMLARKKVHGTEYQLDFTKHVVANLNEDDKNNPLISIYLNLFHTFNDEIAENSFEQFKVLFETNKDKIPLVEKREILSYAINFCNSQANKNIKRKYYAEQSLDLYLIGIGQKILFDNGKLSPLFFNHVVRLGFNLRKYEFIEKFIQDYYTDVEDKFQEDAFHFNLADLHYRKKEYGEAQLHLLKVQYSHTFYSLGSKEMLLRIYFETNEAEALFALIASFSNYLRRNKIITKRKKEAYLNFTTILGRIVRAHKEKYPAIVEKINDTKYVCNRNWLLEICQPKRSNS